MKFNRRKSRRLKSLLPLCLALILVLGCTIGGTLAYMKVHSGSVTNTFRNGEITYTLTLEANAQKANAKYDDSDVTMPLALSAKKDTALSVVFEPNAEPSLEGYTFSGWYYDDACQQSYVNVNSSTGAITVKYGDEKDSNADPNKVAITLYADWTANEYTVHYDGNGATGGATADSAHVYDEAKALTANGYTRTGYTFAGWNTKDDGSGDSYTDQQSVTNLTAKDGNTVTLYAQWTPYQYTVKYNSNVDPNATGITQPTGSTADSVHTYDEPKPLTKNGFVRTGYTFIGWNTQADGKGTPYSDGESVTNLTDVQNGTVTLYAQWGVKSYVIRFHANGGIGTMADQAIEWDKLTALSKNTYTYDGDYKFTGWATSPDGAVEYLDQEQVVNLVESGVLDLYAVWKQNTHTVTFDYNIGYGVPPTKEVAFGEPYGALPPYLTTETENLFNGWYTAPSDGTRVYSDTIVNQKANHTLYAQWATSPANDVIKELVVHNSADDDRDGVVDEMHLEFVCSSSFEKFNVPLTNLIPGQKYVLTYTTSNNASFGDYINGYKNARYGSYILPTATEDAGNIDTAVAQDILATWDNRIEPDGTNDGTHAAINDEFLNGPWVNRTITFTATAETMYWAWEFGLIQDGIRYDYNIYDISLVPVPPTIEFGNKDLVIYSTSKAQILNDNSSAYASSFTFDGDGYAETMYYPITGLTAGTTYTITFDHLFEGRLIHDTVSTANPSYHYGCGIMGAVPTVYGSYMNSLGTYLSNTYVMPSVTGNTQSVTLTFKATGSTAYWVWNMANCSDTINCPIDIKVTKFSAVHSGGGSITYYTAPSMASLDLAPMPENASNEISLDYSGIDDTYIDIWYPVDEQNPVAGDSYEVAFEPLNGCTMSADMLVIIDGEWYTVEPNGWNGFGVPYYEPATGILIIPAELLTEQTQSVTIVAAAEPLETDPLTDPLAAKPPEETAEPEYEEQGDPLSMD